MGVSGSSPSRIDPILKRHQTKRYRCTLSRSGKKNKTKQQLCLLPLPSFGPMQLKDVAVILKRTLLKFNKAFDHPPYNYMLHTAALQVDVGEVLLSWSSLVVASEIQL